MTVVKTISMNLPARRLSGVAKPLFLLLALAAMAPTGVVRAESPPPAAEKPAPAGDGRELLSSHDTVARFTGIRDHRCRGLTSLCPDRCGDSGRLATFEIVQYLAYEKPGKYGDEKQQTFSVLIEDNLKNAKVPAAVLKAIDSLKPGQTVRLQWNHDYVTRGGSKFPERPIVRVEPMTPEQVEAAKKPASKPE